MLPSSLDYGYNISGIRGKNDFIKFHAMQSIATFLPLTILGWIFGGFRWGCYPFSFVFTMISWLIWIDTFILWVILMVKAYKGERYKLPIVGDIVEATI